MVFKVRYYYRYVAFLLSILILHSCSGYRWVNDSDYTTPSIEQKTLFVVHNGTPNIYHYIDVTRSKTGFIGVVNTKHRLKVIPKHKNTMVIYTDSLAEKHKDPTLNELTIPYESITKIRKYEFNKATQVGRNISLAIACIFIVAIPFTVRPNIKPSITF